MANGLALALWFTWFLWRRLGIALSSGRFLNRGVQPATIFGRMASPREGRRRHGVGRAPHEWKVARSREKRGEKARGKGQRRGTREGTGARRAHRKSRAYSPRGHTAGPYRAN